MNAWQATGVCVAAAALAWAAPAVSGPLAASPPVKETRSAPAPLRLLDVPYVPQSEALCGGAALAMVLRYWGANGVFAEDFAALVAPGEAGIRTGALVQAVEDRGWLAQPLPASMTALQSQLAQGRPVIALIQVGEGAHHYVVLVAWAQGRVILHDPRLGPWRTLREDEFGEAWSGSGRWALLVLPLSPQGREAPGVSASTAVEPPMPEALDDCGALVEAGLRLAAQGDSAHAELSFLAAQAMCPASAAPLRERAGLRFRAEDWPGARRLATRALALDPSDVHARRLLAGSAYLAGDIDAALEAWNALSEPRTDLTRIDGLRRTRYAAVAAQLDLPAGELLTAPDWRRARRRLAELPAQTAFRLSLQPLPQGIAQVNVMLLERPLLVAVAGPWELARTGIKALTGQELAIEVASPTGNGELWTAGWRWWEERPRVALAVAIPAAGGRPGIWRLEGSWERQAYAARSPAGASSVAAGMPSREERRRTSLSVADWLAPDLRLELGLALDKWVDRGAHLSLAGGVERRWARDRLALGAQAASWVSLAGGSPFTAGGLTLAWCASGLDAGDGWQGRLGLSSASAAAPLALWSGAGTGQGRAPLLRAHPLLAGGVIEGAAFGRRLVHGTIERQAWPWTLGPLGLGWALFVDGARAWETGRAERVPWLADGGAGLRLRRLGMKGQLRIDAALGLVDGNRAVSLGWQIP
jgi:hypothetical protein